MLTRLSYVLLFAWKSLEELEKRTDADWDIIFP